MKNVTVIGAGIMGHGIAQVVAASGIPVVLNDISDEILQKGRAKIEASLERGIQKGKMDEAGKQAALERLTLDSSLENAVGQADLVVESASENLEIKKTIFQQLDQFCKPEAILATNTSQFSITEIASAVSTPERVVGMHWFNPPVTMKLIEIARGLATSDEVLETISGFARGLGKEIVVCKDSQGFISTRVLLALRLECYRLLEEGISTKEDIDKTLRLAFGHPMGQFELADFSGLDTELVACRAMADVFGDRFRPPQNLVQTVKAGRMGRKSGQGWFKY
ncbi:MAG: 3-hydroxyacyl-CoA dehydrogenase family protein [Deltaproteobacteria bacterium]|nr:3-hydroxyacyl-CoA dehydrogenase family protein [Deltaproteobacteria bacterium]